ncbi:MAG: threonine synthase [Spirochaetales bacterium]|nr:threonine synthase [Spirochaetales bacterium]
MYSCFSCGKTYPITEPRWRCDCGGFLVLPEEPVFPHESLATRGFTLWRYREAYGLPEDSPSLSLGEGWTPLVENRLEGVPVWFKLDYLMPSGSFKDRGAAVLVSLCKAIGIKELVEDSSGNAGAAMAAYCTASGIRCRIYAPAYTPEGKLLQIRLYGAEVVKVPGTRQDTSDAVQEAAKSTYYGSHLWNPFFVQGHMSAAFELWEQLGGEIPDTVILPLGSGGYLEGIYRGFQVLKLSGLIKKTPRLLGVQAQNCRPLHEAFLLGLEAAPPLPVEPTVAEGISVSRPPRGAAVLDAVRRSEGKILAVTEEEIVDAHKLLLRRGLYVEPTSAVVLAAWFQLSFPERKNCVLMLTGHGLKESDKIAQIHNL